MNPVSKQIAQDVDSGKYFTEAREWYNNIFVKPSVECAVLYIYAFCAIIMTGLVVYNIYNIFPITENITVVAKLSDTLSYEPKLVYVNDDNKLKDSVANFIGKKYVQARESYNPYLFDQNYYFVYRNSSKEIFDDYNKNFSTSNPQSPLVSYGWKGQILVNINEVKRIGEDYLTVRFTRKGIDNYNRILFQQELVSNINYQMANFDIDDGKNSRIEFVVTKYSVIEPAAVNVKN